MNQQRLTDFMSVNLKVGFSAAENTNYCYYMIIKLLLMHIMFWKFKSEPLDGKEAIFLNILVFNT